MHDLAYWRGFLSSPTVRALHDLPWISTFVFVLTLLHSILGLLVRSGAVLLVRLAILGERWAGGRSVAAPETQAKAI